jgi:vancomycin resistance protein YoaR
MVAVPVVVAVLAVSAWAVDSAASSGEVGRNVEVAGKAVGGFDEAHLREVTAELAVSLTERPVTIRSDGKTYESTAAALGLTLDQDATVNAVLDVGRDGSPLTRPFRWVASWFGTRKVTPRYALNQPQTAAALETVQGADRTAPVEPAMQLTDNGLALAAGQPGRGIDPKSFADKLRNAAEDSTDGPLVIDADQTSLAPNYTDADVQTLVDQANTMTAPGIAIKAAAVGADAPAQRLRSWMTLGPVNVDGGVKPELVVSPDLVKADLPTLVGSVGEAAVNATVTLDEATGTPVVVPGRSGVMCCGDDSGTRILEALRAGQGQVELQVAVAEPEWTTEEVQAWGITQPIGGSRGWQSGHEVPGPGPGFTTFHDCCAARVSNIHRLADLVRGAVIAPGADFSINDYIGPRTSAKGFVLAGAIAQGQHVEEIGGGVSQFATTTFNAAYFAGLDILEYQAHTEWFSRYPRGREATMGYPKPDLRIHNNTPYGLMIWTSYTGTSLTVTFYSTPWASAEQTGISEGSSGACRTVVTTRTRWFPDGTSVNDQFRATYRPGEGQFC